MPALKLIATPDAELLRIGAELDKVEHDRRALLEAERRRRSAREAACRAVRLTRPDHQAEHNAWAVYERRLAMVPYAGKDADFADCNEQGESIAANKIDDRMIDLFGRAAAITATTVAGLGVQLRAMELAMQEDFDDQAHQLLAAAMRFAGVEPARA